MVLIQNRNKKDMTLFKKLSLLCIFLGINISAFAQDCACKQWKWTHYDSGGQIRFDYSHGCSQPSSEWEFVGYDYEYCESKKKEREFQEAEWKKRAEMEKNKIRTKDGFTVDQWYYDFSPYLGTKKVKDLVYNFEMWGYEGEVIYQGTMNQGKIDGVLYAANGIKVADFQDNFYQMKIFWKSKEIFYYDNTSKQYLFGNKSIDRSYPYYLVDNGEILMAFTLNIKKEEALKIFEKIKGEEFINQKQKRLTEYQKIKRGLEQIQTEDSLNIYKKEELLIKKPLDLKEKSILGSWTFESITNEVNLVEKLELNADRSYKVQYLKFNSIVPDLIEEGFWFVDQDRLFLHRKFDTKQKLFEQDLYAFISSRIEKINEEYTMGTFLDQGEVILDVDILAGYRNDMLKRGLNPYPDIYFYLEFSRKQYFNKNEINYESQEYNELLKKIKSMSTLESYKEYCLNIENNVISSSKLDKISNKEIIQTISSSQIPRMISYRITSDSFTMKGYKTSKEAKVQRRRKNKQVIVKTTFYSAALWLGLRLFENSTVK
jgi:hypothetical protein